MDRERILADSNMAYLWRRAGKNVKICSAACIEPILINLTPTKETVKRNRGERELTEKEFNRIEYLYETDDIGNPKIGFIVDNTNQIVKETVEEVMVILEEGIKIYL